MRSSPVFPVDVPQCPQAHSDLKQAPGAYHKNYNFLYPHSETAPSP